MEATVTWINSVELTHVQVFRFLATVLKSKKSTDKLIVRSHIVIHCPSLRVLHWTESWSLFILTQLLSLLYHLTLLSWHTNTDLLSQMEGGTKYSSRALFMFMKGTFYMRAILIFMSEYSVHLPPIQTVCFKMSVSSVLEYFMVVWAARISLNSV